MVLGFLISLFLIQIGQISTLKKSEMEGGGGVIGLLPEKYFIL